MLSFGWSLALSPSLLQPQDPQGGLWRGLLQKVYECVQGSIPGWPLVGDRAEGREEKGEWGMRTHSFVGSQHRAESGGSTGEGSATPPANISGEDRERLYQQLNE